jgi:hypothetical protein
MKKIFNILFISFSCLAIKAQTVEKIEPNQQSGLTDAELQKAIDSYICMTETETYKANKRATNEMVQKLNLKITGKEMAINYDWNEWITENWKKTKFISINEANKLRNQGLELTKKLMSENSQLFEMIRKATMEQRHIILKPERASRPF